MRDVVVGLSARAGYASRGVVYLLIGGLALLGALGGGGKTSGSKGALATLAGSPWGGVSLTAIAVGLFGYAAWRAIQALLDSDGHGVGTKGLVVRAGLMTSAVTHTLLGLYALSLLSRYGGESGGSGSKGAAAWLLQQPFGPWLLGAVAIVIAGAGGAQIWKGCSGKFRDRLDMHAALMRRLAPLCAFGLIARGLVFVIVGGFFLYAACTLNPAEAGGLADALHWLRSQSYGGALLGIMAAGLLAFGLYSIVEAIWRRVDMS